DYYCQSADSSGYHVFF
nr:immunoglobulin light chain junction region [Macaca mulatta]